MAPEFKEMHAKQIIENCNIREREKKTNLIKLSLYDTIMHYSISNNNNVELFALLEKNQKENHFFVLSSYRDFFFVLLFIYCCASPVAFSFLLLIFNELPINFRSHFDRHLIYIFSVWFGSIPFIVVELWAF